MGQGGASPSAAAAAEAAEREEVTKLIDSFIAQINGSDLDSTTKSEIKDALNGLSSLKNVGAVRQALAEIAQSYRDAGNRAVDEKNAHFAIAEEYPLSVESEQRYRRALRALAENDPTEIFFAMNKGWDDLAKSNPDIKATIEGGLRAANKSSSTMHALENVNDAVSHEFCAKSMRRELHNLQTLEDLQKDPAYAEYGAALDTMRKHHLFSFVRASDLLDQVRHHKLTPEQLTKEVKVMDEQALGLADAILQESSNNLKGSSIYLRKHFLKDGKVDMAAILVVKEKMLNNPDLVKEAVEFYNAHGHRFDAMKEEIRRRNPNLSEEKIEAEYRKYADVIMVLKKGAVVEQAMTYHGVVQAMQESLRKPIVGEDVEHGWNMLAIFDKGGNRDARLDALRAEMIEHGIINGDDTESKKTTDMLNDFLNAADLHADGMDLLRNNSEEFTESLKMVALARITTLAPEDIAWAYKNDEKLYREILSLYDTSINADEGDFVAEQQALREHSMLVRRKAEGGIPEDPAVPGLTPQVAAAARQAAAGVEAAPTSPSAPTASPDGALAQAAQGFSRSGVTQAATGAINSLPTGQRAPLQIA